jgi:type I restriction enzyme S subunit
MSSGNRLPDGWRYLTVDEIKADSPSSVAIGPFGSRMKSDRYVASGVPVIRGNNISNTRELKGEFVYVDEQTADELRSSAAYVDDLVFPHRGLIGEVAIVSSPPAERYILSTSLMKLTCNRDLVDPSFVFYFFRSPAGRNQLLRYASTVGTPGIGQPLSSLRSVRVPVPSLPEQRAIAAVLRVLDDKIENSLTIADRATKLALAEGQAILADPKGPIVSLASVASMTKGVSYRSEDLADGGSYLVSLKCVGRNGTFQLHGLKPYRGEYRPEQVVKHGDVVVAQTDLTQRAEVIGRPVRVQSVGAKDQLVASLDLIIVRPQGTLTRETLLTLLSTQDFRDHALSYCNGTTVLHMSARCLPDYSFRLPTDDALVSATAIMQPLLARADAAEREGLVVAEVRDVLLPRLLSGELRVREAEELVEEAV